jgi:Cation transport ATPase
LRCVYLDSASITLRGVLGTPVVLAAIASVVVLQLLFTYLPWFQSTFTTAALSLEQLAFSVVAGVVVLVVLELETAIRNRVKAVRG